MDRRLRYLFLDVNSFFAACEQQKHPELRDRPVAVAPLDSDSTVAVAASKEAKRFGVKCGVNIGDAKRMCPGLIIVGADFKLYKAYHEAIKETAEKVLPIEEVHSIDEMSFRLLGVEREPDAALKIAKEMKKVVAKELGDVLTFSIGIAPNRFLAKIGTELQKPDGLVVIRSEDLPHRLFELGLRDFPGINVKMERRLNASLIFSTEAMCNANKNDLHNAFGSVIGEKWWYLLRGYDLEEEKTTRKSLSHSHVLAPDLRTDQGARDVLLRLLQKGTARLRSEDLFTERLSIGVSSKKKPWGAEVVLPPTQDSLLINARFNEPGKNETLSNPTKSASTSPTSEPPKS